MKALFVGRFQPFHTGHLKALEHASKIINHIIIGIGSSKEKNTLENPFSFKERAEMIKSSIKFDKSLYTIKPIPDFHDNEKWVNYIKDNLPAFDVVFTNSPNEKKIFRAAHFTVHTLPFYKRSTFNASDIRRIMSAGGDWTKFVPAGTAKVVKKIKGVDRINKLVIK